MNPINPVREHCGVAPASPGSDWLEHGESWVLFLRAAAIRSPAPVGRQAVCHTLNTGRLDRCSIAQCQGWTPLIRRQEVTPSAAISMHSLVKVNVSVQQVTKSAQLPSLPPTLSGHPGFPASTLVLRRSS